ncbi:MAG TPA: hypothetical protein VMW69_15685 [Spirochaetia bacterium]|nr:hypothetical protein [Spirochaetia bacterium]
MTLECGGGTAPVVSNQREVLLLALLTQDWPEPDAGIEQSLFDVSLRGRDLVNETVDLRLIDALREKCVVYLRRQQADVDAAVASLLRGLPLVFSLPGAHGMMSELVDRSS